MKKSTIVHSSQLAMTLLKAVGVTGVIVASIALPGFGVLAHHVYRAYEKEKWQRMYRSLYHLQKRGFVQLTWLKNGRINVVLTKQGKTIIKKLDIEELTIPKPARWDKAWRVVIFDVPNWKSKNRLAFTQKLKNLGFVMIQKSVWAYPYPCHDEIMILRKFYDIEKCVTYLETAMVEDEYLWRGHFHL